MAFKLSSITWSHHYSVEIGKYDDFKLIELYAKYGLGGIEFIIEHLTSLKEKHLLKIKKHANDNGLIISAVSPGNNFGMLKDSAQKKQIKYVINSIDTAYILGALNVRVFAGWPQDKPEKLWKKAVNAMKEVSKYAEKKGITLVVEPHNDGGFLPDSKTTIKFLKDVNSPFVKLNLDTGNFLHHDKDLYKAIESVMKYAVYSHIKIHKISKDGKTQDFDLDKIFKILSKNDYRGFLAIEYEGQEFIKGDKKERAKNEDIFFPIVVKKIKNLIKKYY